MYIENPKEFTNTTNKFSKVERNKIKIQKSTIFLYSSNDHTKNLINDSSYNSIKKNKILRANQMEKHPMYLDHKT